jgi:DNA-binding CsgD family transcriptional regulator
LLVPVEVLGLARALAAARDGDPAAALAGLVAVFDPDGDWRFLGLGPLTRLWAPDLVRLALSTGDAELARAATQATCTVLDPAARHCLGLVAGDLATVRLAAAQLATLDFPLFAARGLEDAAAGFAERGDGPAARAAHADAVAIYEGAGATWDVRRADARLRGHGIRRGRRGPRCRGEDGWDALTPTEQRVARLVAGGLSNADIAGHLVVSRYTVQSHISHILTKLGARSRIDIARVAVEAEGQVNAPPRAATPGWCSPGRPGTAELSRRRPARHPEGQVPAR